MSAIPTTSALATRHIVMTLRASKFDPPKRTPEEKAAEKAAQREQSRVWALLQSDRPGREACRIATLTLMDRIESLFRGDQGDGVEWHFYAHEWWFRNAGPDGNCTLTGASATWRLFTAPLEYAPLSSMFPGDLCGFCHWLRICRRLASSADEWAQLPVPELDPGVLAFSQLVKLLLDSPWLVSPTISPATPGQALTCPRDNHARHPIQHVPEDTRGLYRARVRRPPRWILEQMLTVTRQAAGGSASPTASELRLVVPDDGAVPAWQAIDTPGGERVVDVLNRRIPIESPRVWKLLRRMQERFPLGLKLDDVRRVHSKGSKELRKLAAAYPEMAAAIHFPGQTKSGFKVRNRREARREYDRRQREGAA